MRIVVIACLITALSVGVCRAEVPTPEKIATTFFDTMIKGDDAKAVDDFFSLDPLFKEKRSRSNW